MKLKEAHLGTSRAVGETKILYFRTEVKRLLTVKVSGPEEKQAQTVDGWQELGRQGTIGKEVDIGI